MRACVRACVAPSVVDTMYQLIYTSAQTRAWRVEFSYKDIRDYYARLKGRVRVATGGIVRTLYPPHQSSSWDPLHSLPYPSHPSSCPVSLFRSVSRRHECIPNHSIQIAICYTYTCTTVKVTLYKSTSLCPNNRCHTTFFFEKIMDLSLPISIAVLHEMY